MTTAIYTAEALSTGGGRNGHVRSSDGLVDLDLAAPVEMGGSGAGSNPEQLFAAGYAACFHSALQGSARAAKVALGDSSVGASVGVGPSDDGSYGLVVHLEVVVPDLPHEQAQALAEEAHRRCPYSNAIRGNVEVAISVSDD